MLIMELLKIPALCWMLIITSYIVHVCGYMVWDAVECMLHMAFWTAWPRGARTVLAPSVGSAILFISSYFTCSIKTRVG